LAEREVGAFLAALLSTVSVLGFPLLTGPLGELLFV
jgi:hypothetical protein